MDLYSTNNNGLHKECGSNYCYNCDNQVMVPKQNRASVPICQNFCHVKQEFSEYTREFKRLSHCKSVLIGQRDFLNWRAL